MLLQTLIELSEKKEISYTKKQLEKMSEERLEQIYEEYKRKELDDLNEAVTDTIIFKVDELMKGCGWVKSDSKLGLKLQKKKLFRNDLKNVVSYITPYLPFVGFLEGGITVLSEVIDKLGEKEPEVEKEPETEEN